MNMNSELNIDEKRFERLKMRIILEENQNLRNKNKNNSKMIKHIQNLIEEEVKCCLKQ